MSERYCNTKHCKNANNSKKYKRPDKNETENGYCDRANKILYFTKELAKTAMYNQWQYNREVGRLPIRVYRCDFCGGWHLTSKCMRDGKNGD
ncbi:MAG: hypothetical protein LBM09_03055 [Candidatus Nomurabacteria bacterium]|jgi:hypothetical protein|nr:hypothetical protein [Candidatus Nomurabacteria bacterium]